MKKLLIIFTFISISLFAKSQIFVDSSKIFSVNDTAYYLGIYGVLMPSGPCEIIDSSIQITQDSIIMSLCYLYGGGQSQICRGSDSIYLGSLNGGSYNVIIYLASTDTFNNSCNVPFKKDTIVFLYTITGINEPKSAHSTLSVYPNPSNSFQVIEIDLEKPTQQITIRLYDVSGKMVKDIFNGSLSKGQTQFNIDLATLQQGLYIYTIEGRDMIRLNLKTLKL